MDQVATATLPRFDASASPDELARALEREGGVIVERLADDDVLDGVEAETRRHREATAEGRDDFSGHRTRRTGALLARSPSAHALIAHPSVLGVCARVLGTRATSWQLHLTQLIDIGPGEPAQMLHRDQWAWDFFPFPVGFEVEVSTIWALTDFTEANGATHLVPGSHRWEDVSMGDARIAAAAAGAGVARATMPRGSVVMYLGSTVHGAGANASGERRVGVNVDYCLSWLRQEENQYLACPPEVARTLPRELARLAGYARGAYALGYFGDTQDPMEALHPDAEVAGGLGR